ncbi:DUF4232 domain-containing protein [Streptomyces sp. TRM76323]|uniref:DUF4232 domain-containing protein n=1 Tax=Streptomyces tamarix TaxID=3078565 RepID=A0ABU3QIE9_9ACTN|nr:DUF4232 domain-containing protein [Streptomyces tamarix]MDT9682550.1 DUF4232 domain-containing protein [Streptomyces tamarix]
MRTRGSAVVTAAAVVTVVTAGCSAGGAAPDAASPPPSAPVPGLSAPAGPSAGACPGSGVRVTLGATETALGLRALSVFLDNCGGRPFEVSGYPEVAVLDAEREELDVTVRLGTDAVDGGATRSTFVLRPGQRARSGILWRNTVTRSDVTATNGAYLRVTPGRGAAAQTVAPHDGPLDLGTTDAVEVTPWTPEGGT